MDKIDLAKLEITANPSDADEDQFVTLWNIASSTMGGDQQQTRFLASKLLGFLCKHRCGLLTSSSSDLKYLDERFERDNSLLYDWKPESEQVDIITQHVSAHFESLRNFLRDKRFRADKNYSPRRVDRVEWFTNDWNVG